MDRSDDGDPAYHMPLGGIIGITVGGAVLIVGLLIFICCRVQTKKKRRRSDISFDRTMRRGLSTKENTFNLSWRKSDEDDNLRPTSGDSNATFQFDANLMRSRDNTGRVSYDTPYSVLQKLETDQAEVQKRRLENGVSTRNVVSGYGMVSMVSPGYYDTNSGEVVRTSFPPPPTPLTGSYIDNNSVEVDRTPAPPPPPQQPHQNDGFMMQQGQGQAGRLPESYEYATVHHVKMRWQEPATSEPDYNKDSFRSSMAVDLGADIDKAQRMID